MGARRMRRGLLLAALLAGAGWAAWTTGRAETADAAARAGAELTRLLRCMAVLKATMAAATLGAVWWRMALPAEAGRLLAYLLAAAAMAAGPVLIWTMVHLGAGSLLLHGGLVAALVLLWRDPDLSARLGELVVERRRALASRLPAPRRPASGAVNAAAVSGRPAPRPYRSRPAR